MIGLGPIAEERERRLQSRLNGGLEAKGLFEASLAPFSGTPLAARLKAAHDFAEAIEYTHAGVSPSSYLAHPIRVASLALKLVSPPSESACILGLLHNVFEVSNVSVEEIGSRFGTTMAAAISSLKVDRTNDSRDGRLDYYRRLADCASYIRVIKLLDKFDNLFLLCLNPSAATRTAYLAEVEEFIYPIARAELPALVPYLQALVQDCRRVGCVDHFATPEHANYYGPVL